MGRGLGAKMLINVFCPNGKQKKPGYYSKASFVLFAIVTWESGRDVLLDKLETVPGETIHVFQGTILVLNQGKGRSLIAVTTNPIKSRRLVGEVCGLLVTVVNAKLIHLFRPLLRVALTLVLIIK
jgi:hypothetical protein